MDDYGSTVPLAQRGQEEWAKRVPEHGDRELESADRGIGEMKSVHHDKEGWGEDGAFDH